jgi:hypothetical protein
MLLRRAEWFLFPIVFSKNVLAFSTLFYTPCGWITIQDVEIIYHSRRSQV